MIGFQAKGTLGRELVDGAQKIRLWKTIHAVRAKVHTIGGLSAHADQKNLVDWYRHFKNTPPVVLTHGEEDARVALAEMLKMEGASVLMPSKGDQVVW